MFGLSSVLNEFQESSQCSQDSMREDSFVSSAGPDQYSETAIFSCSDSETPPTPSQDQPQQCALSDSELAPEPPEQPASSEEEVEEIPLIGSPPGVCLNAPSELTLDATMPSPIGEPAEEACSAAREQVSEASQEFKETESRDDAHQDAQSSTSVLNKTTSETLSVSMFQNISHL